LLTFEKDSRSTGKKRHIFSSEVTRGNHTEGTFGCVMTADPEPGGGHRQSRIAPPADSEIFSSGLVPDELPCASPRDFVISDAGDELDYLRRVTRYPHEGGTKNKLLIALTWHLSVSCWKRRQAMLDQSLNHDRNLPFAEQNDDQSAGLGFTHSDCLVHFCELKAEKTGPDAPDCCDYAPTIETPSDVCRGLGSGNAPRGISPMR
jgi:hypothetical protein